MWKTVSFEWGGGVDLNFGQLKSTGRSGGGGGMDGSELWSTKIYWWG